MQWDNVAADLAWLPLLSRLAWVSRLGQWARRTIEAECDASIDRVDFAERERMRRDGL